MVSKINIFYPHLKCLLEVAEGINFSQLLISTINTEPAKMVLLFLSRRSIKSAYAFILLDKRGYGEDVYPILRSILENTINIKFIYSQNECDLWAERYIEYQNVLSKKTANNYLKHGEKDNLISFIREKCSELDQEISSLKSKYGSNFGDYPYTWSGKTIRQMARDCKMEYYYDVIYNFWSDFCHGNIRSSNGYMESINNQIKFIERKTHVHDREYCALFDFIYKTVEIVNDKANLNLSKTLESIKSEFVKAAKYS